MSADEIILGMTRQEIVEKHFNTVYRLALSQTKNVADAEDITQDVFLRFMQYEKPFASFEHIKAWLIRVTINRSLSLFASAWHKRTEPLSEEIPFNSPEKSDVYYAVLELPQKYRAVIHLFYYEDMSVAEISKVLGKNQSTIKSQLHRARELLKTKLKGEYDYV